MVAELLLVWPQLLLVILLQFLASLLLLGFLLVRALLQLLEFLQ